MLKQFLAIICLLLFLPVLAIATSSTELPKTGQTSCWNATGTKVPCDNTGQDGDNQGGLLWPTPRFSVGVNTVVDNLTGLEWTKDGNRPLTVPLNSSSTTGALDWNAALTYVKDANSANTFAHNDWRLPNINELESLVNLEQANNAAWLNSQGFNNVQAESYWSSTTYTYKQEAIVGAALNGALTNAAWHVNMLTGYVGTSDKPIGKSYNYYVWMVRDSGTAGKISLPKTGLTACWDADGVEVPCANTGQDGELQTGTALPSPRFANNGDGTATDSLTGLVWLRDRYCLGPNTTIPLALDSVSQLSTGVCDLADGSLPGDWRLPNRNEMMSVVNRNVNYSVNYLESEGLLGFDNLRDNPSPTNEWYVSTFCTSDTGAANPKFGWIVYLGNQSGGPNDIKNGFIDYGSKVVANTCAAWAVRSGQWGHPVISAAPASKDFGSVAATVTSPAQAFTITNTGKGTLLNAGLTVSSIGTTGGNNVLFAVAHDGSLGTCKATPFTLAVGESCTVNVTFTPDTAGAKSTKLRITSNDLTTPNLDIALSGTGTLPTYVISSSVVGGNGTISCTSPITQGGSSVCTITPALGYHLATFTDNGQDKISSVISSSYTIANVAEVHAVSGTFAAGAAAKLPKTGQTTCWNAAGAPVACTSTGQDGDKQGGVDWPATRFTNNADATITDNLTGLMWTQNANLAGAIKTWQSALDYVKTVNAGGYTDWRLPNINELESLVNEQQSNLASWLNLQGFNNVQAAYYWSSTSNATDSKVAWNVNMLDGRVGSSSKSSSYAVWSVRSAASPGVVTIPQSGQMVCWDELGNSIACAGTGQDGDLKKGALWPSPRFVDNSDGTVLDNLTGLIWLKKADCGLSQTLANALALGNTLATGACGLTDGSKAGDWRLPNRKELMSLMDRGVADNSAALIASGFSGVSGASAYWTSGTNANAPGYEWLVYLNSGQVDFGAKGGTQGVWMVRSGQWGHPVAFATPASKDFGNLGLGVQSSAQVFTITNTGNGTSPNADLVISSIGMTGGNTTLFAVNPGNGTAGTCGPAPVTLVSGMSCTVSVTFTPDTAGAKSTTLRIVSNDQATPNLDFALSGTGALPTYTISSGVVGGNGTISCTSPITQGGTSVCTITPALGYDLLTFTDNAVDKLASVVSYSYTIANVSADHVIAGTFSAVAPIAGSAIKLPKTGQTGCWNVAGASIACASTGQDGDKQGGIDWPATRFTNNGDGTVTDNLTGLMWIQDANRAVTLKTWQAALDYVNIMNSGIGTLGYTDWRLPNINELESLANEQQPNLASWLNLQGFNNVQADYYWSSTSNVTDTKVAWDVSMLNGRVGSSGKSASMYVWTVRTAVAAGVVTLPQTGQTGCWNELGTSISCSGTGQDGDTKTGAVWPSPRFIDNSDGTVIDNLTGLVWLKNAACVATPQTLANALTQGNTLATGSCGLTDGSKAGDWRLPNRKELMSLMDRGIADNSTALVASGFTGVSSTSAYWTSSTDANAAAYEWLVYLKSGQIDFGVKSGSQNTWLVRSGQWGHPVASALPASLSFGSVAVNATSTPKTITISNTGNGTSPNANLNISSIDTIGGNNTLFAVNLGDGTAGTCGPVPIRLFSGLSCTVSVSFTPDTSGTKTTNLRITSDDSSKPTIDLALSGSGAVTTYTVTGSVVGGNGTISCTSPVAQGSSSVCTITPSANYSLATLTDNAVDVFASVVSNQLTISNVTADHTVIGTFVAAAPINGVCGSSNNGTFMVAPTSNLCSVGTSSAVSGSGPWSWTCFGQYGGTTASCSANKFSPITINNSAGYTKSRAVTLHISAPNGEQMMRIGNNPGSMSKWIPVTNTMAWTLPYTNGLKTVYVNFRDINAPANAAYAPYTASIVLDTVLPKGRLLINNASTLTNNPLLDLVILPNDKNGISSMCIKEDATVCLNSDYIQFTNQTTYNLIDTKPGKKILTIRLKDPAGNISLPIRSSIMLQ